MKFLSKKIGVLRIIKREILTEKNDKDAGKKDFFMEMLNGCLIITDEKNYPDYIFYTKNNEILFEFYIKNCVFYIRYDKIWRVFEQKHGMNYEQIQAFIKDRLETHLKQEVKTTNAAGQSFFF